MREHVVQLSSKGSRVTGYLGYYAAKEYIKTLFSEYGEEYEYGFELEVQEYNVTVPLELETRLKITSPSNLVQEVEAYTLWPNDVQTSPTPPEGVTGKLIYAGEGNLEDFDGYDVEGSIVLMDFNTGNNWLNAAKLGAKAVIFIQPEETTYLQCMSKFLSTPIHFTRLYVSREDGELLKKATEVQIVSRMFYRTTRAENIIAKFNGTDPNLVNDIIVISAHYDAWSPVPNMSYAAHEAIAPSILLELAKFFSKNPPSRSVWLVALSGHWEALAGAREFVEKYYFGPEVLSGKQRLWVMLSLWGIDSQGNGLEFLVTGHYNFYGAKPSDSNLNLRYAEIGNMIERFLREPALVNAFQQVTQEELGLRGLSPWNFTEGTTHNNQYASTTFWYGTEAYPYMLDSEPATIAGGIGLGLSTRNTYRQYRGTPNNDLEEIDFKKTKPQLMVIAYLAYRLTTEQTWNINWPDVEPTRINMINPTRSWPGFITINGRVESFNVSRGWYDPMPGALVEASIGLSLPFQRIITMADESGRFIVHGVAPAATGGTAVLVMGTRTGMLFEWFGYAWILNETDGSIEYALDYGINGVQRISNVVAPLRHPEELTVVIGRSVPITVFDLIDPRTLRPSAILDPRFSGYWQQTTTRAGFFYISGAGTMPIDFPTKSPLLKYGFYFVGWEPVALVFVPKGSEFVVGLGFQGSQWPAMVLTNSTEEAPEGNGLTADKSMTITFTAYKAAVDMLRMSESRYSMMSSRFAGSASIEKKVKMAEAHLAKARDAVSRKAWSEAYDEALTSWALAYRAYATEIMPLINDASTSALVIFVLTILSAYFWERLLVHKEEKGRLFSMIAVGGVLLAIFSLIHPAITLMSNVFMGLLGALIFIVFLIALLLLTRLGEQVRKTFELEILGIHRSESSWVDVVSTSVSVGLENMRKRRFRTALTLATIIVTTIALTSFTSVSYYTFEELVLGGEGGYHAAGYYNGILIKEEWGAPPTGALDPTLVQTVKSVVGKDGYVLPRAWYYPPSHPYTSPYVFENLTTPYRSVMVFSALGITVDDFNLTFRDATTGFGFSSKEIYKSCLLSATVANQLFPARLGEEPHPEVAVGKTVKAFGLNLTIAGIFDNLLPDLDTPSELLLDCGTPVDPRYSGLLNPARALPLTQVNIPVMQTPPNQTIIVPYELAMDLGGYLGEVVVKFDKGITREKISAYAQELASFFDGKVFMSWGGEVYRVSRIRWLQAVGWELVPAILVIGALNVATTILGNVKERTKDIFVFSSVGLSPLGASILFLVESVTYAVIGTTIGYLSGLGFNAFLITLNIVPAGHVFNYASIFVVIALVAILISALASSTYPSFVASRLITPSLERKWKPPTKPHHEEWTMDLPAVLTSIDEAYGLIEYLWGYYTGAGAAKPSFIVREIAPPSFGELKLELGTISLAPYETHTDQRVVVQCFRAKGEKELYNLGVYLKMLSGNRSVWVSSNYYLIDDLRKQILIWRSLPQETREKLVRTGKEALERSK